MFVPRGALPSVRESELPTDEPAKRVFDFVVPRDQHPPTDRRIGVDVVARPMPYQLTTRAREFPNELASVHTAKP